MATARMRPVRSAWDSGCGPEWGLLRQGARASSRWRWPLLAFAALASACTNVDRTSAVEPAIVESQAGPVVVKVLSNGAAGIPDSELSRLVQVGVRQGCRGDTDDRIRAAADPMLSMRWKIQRAGAPRPLVLVTASLFSQGRRVGFAFDRVPAPNTAPDSVFEYAIASLTCALYRDAGYLAGAGTGDPATKSQG